MSSASFAAREKVVRGVRAVRGEEMSVVRAVRG